MNTTFSDKVIYEINIFYKYKVNSKKEKYGRNKLHISIC